MRIISNFHDYYDSAQKTGMDKDILYVRNRKELDLNINCEVWHMNYYKPYNVNLMLLGYCGEIFHVFEIVNLNTNIRIIKFSLSDFKKVALSLDIVSENEFRYKWFPSKYKKFAEQNVNHLKEFFHKYQVPLFLIESSGRKSTRLILNPSLKKLNFEVKKDVYTAYQDIFQYVSGVLNSAENKMVQISNEDKIAKHGFNKWSFRKLPRRKK